MSYATKINSPVKIVFGCTDCGTLCLHQLFVDADKPFQPQIEALPLRIHKLGQKIICSKTGLPSVMTIQTHYCQNEELKSLLEKMGRTL